MSNLEETVEYLKNDNIRLWKAISELQDTALSKQIPTYATPNNNFAAHRLKHQTQPIVPTIHENDGLPNENEFINASHKAASSRKNYTESSISQDKTLSSLSTPSTSSSASKQSSSGGGYLQSVKYPRAELPSDNPRKFGENKLFSQQFLNNNDARDATLHTYKTTDLPITSMTNKGGSSKRNRSKMNGTGTPPLCPVINNIVAYCNYRNSKKNPVFVPTKLSNHSSELELVSNGHLIELNHKDKPLNAYTMLPFDDELGPFLANLYNKVGGRVPDILYNFCNAVDDCDQQFTIATAQPTLNLDRLAICPSLFGGVTTPLQYLVQSNVQLNTLIFRNPKNVSNRIA